MNEFAKLFQVMYKWPDDDQWRLGLIIYTNINAGDYESVASKFDRSDDDILIYTDTLDFEEISATFDGLEINQLCQIG